MPASRSRSRDDGTLGRAAQDHRHRAVPHRAARPAVCCSICCHPGSASARPFRQRVCSPAGPSTSAAPEIPSAPSAVATALRTATISHRPTPARRRDSSPDWCSRSSLGSSVRYCESAHSHRIRHRRGCRAATWRRSCRVVPRHPRRAGAGVRRASQLRQGAGAGRRTRFRDHRARRWPGHRVPRRLRQRTAGRRGVRRVRRAARDRARLRPQHHRRVGGGHRAGAGRGRRRPGPAGGAARHARRGGRRRQSS